MPQIGWFEILVIVVLAVLIIGPKDMPIVLKKIGKWTGSIKKYFLEVQNSLDDVENIFDNKISLDEKKIEKSQDEIEDEK